MRSSGVGFALCVALGLVIGCKGGGRSEQPTGRVQLQLRTMAGAFEYELRDAKFEVGPPANLTVQGNPADAFIDVDLPPGGYAVTLLPGWQLHRRVGTEPWQAVTATLLHAATQPFTIVAGQTTSIVYRFGVGPDFIEFGKGRGRITIEVVEQPDGAAGSGGGAAGSGGSPAGDGGADGPAEPAADAAADGASDGDGPSDGADADGAACPPGFADCDGNPTNGCETSLSTPANCGACGTACVRANATATCAMGVCGLLACNGGFGNCDGNAANGCETPLNTLTSCGACGVSCNRANATATCAAGTCQISSCNAGFGNCDNNSASGCEATLNTLTNCGGCGVSCTRTNASETCATGTCQISSCNGGFGNCDNNSANGCEAVLSTTANCGGCGVMCSRANASASCGSGACTLGTCNAGFSSCDGNSTNGCELSHASVSSACASAINLGTFDGDTACGFICGGNTGFDLFTTRTGTTSAFFRARAFEASDCPTSIEHRVTLAVPPGVDYDLFIHRACGGPLRGSSTAGPGQTDAVTFSEGDSSGGDDSFDYIIEVRYVSGASCNSWTLQVLGHDC
jgi:hypothetical protein